VVLIGQNGSATLSGANDIASTYGDGDQVTSTGSGANVTLNFTNSSVTAKGDNDTLTAFGDEDFIALKGTNGSVKLNGHNDTAVIQNNGGGNDTVYAGNESVTVASNGHVSLFGGIGTNAITSSPAAGSITIDLGNGNKAVAIGIPAAVDGFNVNGTHSWEDIYNTLSGALQETDQYSYNSSNALMEIDRSNGFGVKTEADLYDPQTSSEIGSYLYGANGQVDQVIDLLNNHDWISQSDGTFKDQTSGAVSKTQPTLR